MYDGIEARGQPQGYLQMPSTLFLQTGVSLVWSLLRRLGWLVKEFQGSTCLHLPSTKILGIYHSQPFTRVLGMELRSSCFRGKHSLNLVISPAPTLQISHLKHSNLTLKVFRFPTNKVIQKIFKGLGLQLNCTSRMRSLSLVYHQRI